ncbi:MAG: hypothetical protein ACOZNI_11330 [Myxococcota bacterium]
MGATDREFQAQSGFIAACDDPDTLLDWMREYRDSERAAVGRGDKDEARQMEDLAELAEDRIVELKAARIVAATPRPRGPEVRVPAPERAAAPVDDSSAELRQVKEELAASREAQARAERDQARAERERVAAVERAEQGEREQESARVAYAAATPHVVNTAPVAAQNRSPEREAHRGRAREDERLRIQAARALVAKQRPVTAQPPAATARPPIVGQRGPGRRPTPAPTVAPMGAAVATAARPASTAQPVTQARTDPQPPRAPSPPVAPTTELSPLARLFQERLTETTPSTAPSPQPSRPPPTRPTRPSAPPPPPPTAPPPADPVDGLPQHTGADLLAYRTWLGVDQRTLAGRFGVGQGTISKGESKPGTVLGPALRKALHEAMGEPRPDVGGAK